MADRQKPNKKWKAAIGTTSRVPNSGGLHYLIVDFDGPLLCRPALTMALVNVKTICQSTPHGWHLYTNLKMEFNTLVGVLKKIGADPAWVRIGEKRGYFFLADKSEIYFPWPVEHMVIHYGKKKARNT